MENIRDWCISRQLWWGHRIPVWYCRTKNKDCPPIVSRTTPKKCPKCGGKNLTQDSDVLDTWFSSWLWPFVLFGWPEKTPDLEYFYPTSVLNSGKDILFFWDARMIMAGLEFTGKVPFRDIYIHGIARDHLGRKLSKSLGNSPDPIDLIGKYSADALRFGIMANIPLGGDIALSDNVYTSGRNFCNKLWNASRLILSKLTEVNELPRKKNSTLLPFEDRWILSRLNTTIRDYTRLLETYDFSAAAHVVYQFFWHDLCDWYLEIIKSRLYDQSQDTWLHTNLLNIFSTLLRLLHPYIPFVTEEIWQKFRSKAPKNWAESVMIAPWPKAETKRIDASTEKTMATLIGILRGVRDIRSKMDIEPRKPLSVLISAPQSGLVDELKERLAFVKTIGYLDKAEIGVKLAKPKGSATVVVGVPQQRDPASAGSLEIYVPLADVIDFAVERKRLESKLKKLEAQLMGVRSKLANKKFIDRAPEVIVEKERQKFQELNDQVSKLSAALKDLA